MTAPAEVVAFIQREHPRLVGALDLVLGGDVAVAEEIAQEALLRATSRWETVSQLESPGGWTYRVALNLARSHLRRRQAERRARSRMHAPAEQVEETDHAATVELRRALMAMPERDRTVLVLRYYLQLTSAEVADHLGISPAAVRKAASRAVGALRDELGVTVPAEEASHA